MFSEKTIIIPSGLKQAETVRCLSEKGWKILRNTTTSIIMILAYSQNVQSQNIVNWINNDIPNPAPLNYTNTSQPVVGDDVLIFLGNGGDGNNNIKFIITPPSGSPRIILPGGSDIAIVGETVTFETMSSQGNNSCSGISSGEDDVYIEQGTNASYSGMNCVASQILPIKRSEINAYVKNGELKVDAKSEQAVNVDHIDLEVSVNGSDFVVEDKEQAVNGNAPKTYNFSVSVDELIRKHNIVKPTVFYTRLTNHDFDGQTQTSDVQAVEISPDGTVTPLKVFPNIAQNADQISFAIGGDAETLYPVRIIELTTGRVINETFISGATVNKLSDIIGDSQINAGNYVVQSMLNGGVQTTRFVIAK